ncbi:hypothetical protein ACWEBX_23615 [Streptomyces sp. NPDC005070]
MNLAWIVAVMRPLYIAPHPNFSDPDYDTKPYAQLAALVSGNPYRSRYAVQDEDNSGFDRGVLNAEMSLTTVGLRAGLDGLVGEVLSGESGDQARICALGLLACCAAAELDDYKTCDRILKQLLNTTTDDAPESKLLRVAILQQQSLRLRDSGREHSSQSAEALELLADLADRTFPSFPMSPGAPAGPSETIQSIIVALRQATWSLAPIPHLLDGREQLPADFPTWQEVVRTARSNPALEIHRLRATEYAKFVEDSFKQMFRSQTKTIGGRGAATLFYAALHFELLGDSSVYGLREESALMKLVQAMNTARADTNEVADALRLLRHSGAKSEIDLAIERVRATGPLAALKKDAGQIIRNRSEPRMMRAAELRMLRGAADLMTQAEAHKALEEVRRVIDAGGAHTPPGSRQLDVVRLEPAWLAAAHLANTAGENELVFELLLQAALASRQGDELWDKAVGRALRNLDLENVSSETHSRWRAFFESNPSHMLATRNVYEALVRQEVVPDENPLEDLDSVANRVNSAISGIMMSDAEISASITIVSASLAQIRQQAAQGVWSFRSLDAADVAAALIIFANARDMWSDLCLFLTDPRLQRSDKSTAFDRLAFKSVELPPEVEATFRRERQVLLESPSDFEEGSITPYPSALRFLAGHGIIAEPEAFSLIAQLSGSRDPEAREEASRTVAVLASSVATPWLLAQAMQLSHDSEPRVRAHAARALALFFSSTSDFKQSAQRRLIELMAEEGTLVPLLVMRQMRQSENVAPSAKRVIGTLAEDHPSRTVRQEASLLLADDR